MGREIQEQKFIYLHIYNIVEKKSKLGEQICNKPTQFSYCRIVI